MDAPKSIVCVDDNKTLCGLYHLVFKQDFLVYLFTDTSSALAWLKTNPSPSVLLLDGNIDHRTGPQVATLARQLHPNVPILWVTGTPTNDMLMFENIMLLQKPASVKQLRSCALVLAQTAVV